MKTRYLRKLRRVALQALALTIVCVLFVRDSRGDSVAQVQTAKRISASTVALIDPESGTSGGGSGTDVNYAVGDVLTFTMQFTPVPNGAVRGLGGYITEYVPRNTEVVGVRIIDRNGNTVPPHRGGFAADGWGKRNSIDYNGPWALGQLPQGSLSSLYADTGIFYSTNVLTRRIPSAQLITVFNGVEMTPFPTGANKLADRLGNPGGPYYAHNTWDWIQAMAFGTSGEHGTPIGGDINPDGKGNTPYLYGSAVAGPQTYYPYEATQISPTLIEPNNTVGPWNRIKYPGSEIGQGAAVTSAGTPDRVGLPTTLGIDISVDNPLPACDFLGPPSDPCVGPWTNAVRFAVGELVVGDEYFAEVSLRVLASPLDPDLGDANCAEVFGGDASSDGTVDKGKDNSWRYFLPSPACVLLNLFFELNVDKILADVGEQVTYTINVKNLSTNPQTGVVVTDQYDSDVVTCNTADISPAPASNVIDGGTKIGLITWPTIATLAPGEERTYTVVCTLTGTGTGSTLNRGTYTSVELPGSFSTVALTNIGQRALIRLDMTPSVTTVAAGGTFTYTATIKNDGNGLATANEYQVDLPAGFTIVNGTSTIKVEPPAATAAGIGNPTGGPLRYFWLNAGDQRDVDAGETVTITFDVLVDGTVANGLYTGCLSTLHRDDGFGKDIADSACSLGTIAVGVTRSDKPVVSGPIGAGATCVSGTTTEGVGSAVDVFVNSILRGTAASTALGTWQVCSIPTLFGGQNITATVTAAGSLESEPSDPVVVLAKTQCNDGIDNEATPDGLIDYPADPGCETPFDDDESDAPQCSDGIDNEPDGATDWPADLSCSGPGDTTETGGPACSDNIDNDGDSLIDFDGGGVGAADPDCVDANDPTESTAAACSDRVDNDGDLLVDFDGLGNPANADPGCHAAFDNDETDLALTPAVVPARLLIVFDTSGSMNWNICDQTFTGGDGSIDFPGDDVACATCSSASCGNAVADDSRMFKVKAGLSDAVAAFGEIEWGLMRFHQRPVGYTGPTSNAGLQSGGWQGGGADPCSGFDSGDLLVSFAPDNPQSILDYMDGDPNYTGTPPAGSDVELRGSGTTPLFGSLESARTYLASVQSSDTQVSCRPYKIILVTDGQETCGGVPATAAASLFAGTGLSKSVKVHVIGFASAAIKPNLDAIALAGGTTQAIVVDNEIDLSKAIADIVDETILIEVCDGVDNDCDGDTDEDSDPNTFCYTYATGCDVGLGTCVGECGLGANKCVAGGIACVGDTGPTVETCPNDGRDNDCNGMVDDVTGGCPICTPAPEICNGIDDDCDGLIDEDTVAEPLPGVGDSCGVSVGECLPGVLVCDPTQDKLVCDLSGGQGPATEVCDTLDNDCNGLTDEIVNECYTFPSGCADVGAGFNCNGICRTGTEQCEPDGGGGAQLSTCTGQVGPATELCNLIDDDCDGVVDNGFTGPAGEALGTACTVGVGQCRSTGEWQCTGDGTGVECNAPVITPGVELCNNLDDDCDDKIDETDEPAPGGLGPPIGEVCGGGSDCGTGTFECVNGTIECTGVTGGSAEVCNGLDDNCNMIVDEGTDPNTNCYTFASGCTVASDTCLGECKFGLDKCVAGGVACVGDVGPAPETCDGRDNNCDGMVDNQAVCPAADDICVEAECVSPCGATEFPCGFGFYCKDLGDATCASPPCRFCLDDPCNNVTCNAGEVCNQETGACDDPCTGVTCESNQQCAFGGCFNCLQLPCGDGEVCEVATGCVPDPCKDVTCASNETCNGGTCECLFCEPGCGVGERCDTGTCGCVADACQGVTCPGTQVCNPANGMCEGNKCDGVACNPGQACNPDDGLCIEDPCSNAMCPDGQHCEVGFGADPTCVFDVPLDKGDLVYAGGGGGCACGSSVSTAPSGDTFVWLLLVAGALLWRRRREPV